MFGFGWKSVFPKTPRGTWKEARHVLQLKVRGVQCVNVRASVAGGEVAPPRPWVGDKVKWGEFSPLGLSSFDSGDCVNFF